ncbi:peptidoglycan recognition protein [Streptomyces sp. NBC_01260]|uniref:peptidoglycan recognition protein family protein n=1 Tax=unclassified Streptomyces TaxID=2593676 RepID=UPI0022513EB4|nr:MULTISPECIES: peptidoglycan recognition protein [unclassified Streptomyces]MCX4771443.1 peptidoglycan recognition protein [Streptomyces sp. NBC_01285]
MWPHRLALGAAVLPLTLLALRDAPVRPVLPAPAAAAHERPRPVPRGAPQPAVVSRAAWRADERMVREPADYTGAVRAVFIHHTGESSDYDCADVPRMLRAVEEAHIKGNGWDDIGYNFLVDRCGTIYEGRAGGIRRSVRGAHTTGFNADSVGIAVLGDYGRGATVPPVLLRALAKVAAWKLVPGADPRGTVRLVSTSDASRFPKGTVAVLHAVSGHRDAYRTNCPGEALYAELPAIRAAAAALRKAR